MPLIEWDHIYRAGLAARCLPSGCAVPLLARNAVRSGWRAFTIKTTSAQAFESWSNSRKRRACSLFPPVSRSCSVIHSVLGLRVTLQRKIRRR